MKVTRVDHIGIAVKNLDEMVKWSTRVTFIIVLHSAVKDGKN